MADKHTPVERLNRLRRELELRFTGAFADNAVNIIDVAATRITALEAEKAELVKGMRYILPYLEWTIGKESPGYHPTMPSAVADFRATLAKHQEGEGK